MRTSLWLGLAGSLLGITLQGQERPTFAGTWTIDDDASATSGGQRGDPGGNASGGGGRRGGGTGLGPPATRLTIRQDSLTLVVDEERDEGVTTIRYWLNGNRMRNVIPVGRGGTRVSDYQTRWDGTRLETTITGNVGRGATAASTEHREVRYLEPDGRMVVEISIVGQSSIGARKTVYRKAG